MKKILDKTKTSGILFYIHLPASGFSLSLVSWPKLMQGDGQKVDWVFNLPTATQCFSFSLCTPSPHAYGGLANSEVACTQLMYVEGQQLYSRGCPKALALPNCCWV